MVRKDFLCVQPIRNHVLWHGCFFFFFLICYGFLIKTGIESLVDKLASFLSGCNNQTYWITFFCFKLMCCNVQTSTYILMETYTHKDTCAHLYKGFPRSSIAPLLQFAFLHVSAPLRDFAQFIQYIIVPLLVAS